MTCFRSAIHLARPEDRRRSYSGPPSAGVWPAQKQEEFAGIVKSGRTHLMDATPVTLGQEFGGFAAAVEYGVERLESVLVAWPNSRSAGRPLGQG